jgi:hypothetical protein
LRAENISSDDLLRRKVFQDSREVFGSIPQATLRSTWVLLAEAAEGGWEIWGTAFGREEFAALRAKAAAARGK